MRVRQTVAATTRILQANHSGGLRKPRRRDSPAMPGCDTDRGIELMKRAATWLVYLVGAVSIGYLALYGYAMFTRPKLVPGEPIQIFRKPDAPNYS
jgi:hypothetical protein